jgi:ligand-binding sensor domain-containing protein
VDSGRVKWRVASGEGKLPHPWVTALMVSGSDLFVGTYGGGIVRRRSSGAAVASGTRLDPAAYEPFVETEGLKINTGCLVEAAGRIYAGTDGHGLLRLSKDRRRFEPLALALPSPRVTALLPGRDVLLIGTDQGIARLPLAANGVDFGTEAE